MTHTILVDINAIQVFAHLETVEDPTDTQPDVVLAFETPFGAQGGLANLRQLLLGFVVTNRAGYDGAIILGPKPPLGGARVFAVAAFTHRHLPCRS